jgi:RNA polymerase sigma-70 factor (ECF subfamily)
LEPWLYRVTVNLSYTWVSRRSRWLVSLESVIDKLVSPARMGAEYHAEMSEFQVILQRAIDSLPAGQRMTVILYYLNDLSLKEISYILDCPVGTVKSRLHYGREHLKKCLDAYRTAPQLKPASQAGGRPTF